MIDWLRSGTMEMSRLRNRTPDPYGPQAPLTEDELRSGYGLGPDWVNGAYPEGVVSAAQDPTMGTLPETVVTPEAEPGDASQREPES